MRISLSIGAPQRHFYSVFSKFTIPLVLKRHCHCPVLMFTDKKKYFAAKCKDPDDDLAQRIHIPILLSSNAKCTICHWVFAFIFIGPLINYILVPRNSTKLLQTSIFILVLSRAYFNLCCQSWVYFFFLHIPTFRVLLAFASSCYYCFHAAFFVEKSTTNTEDS